MRLRRTSSLLVFGGHSIDRHGGTRKTPIVFKAACKAKVLNFVRQRLAGSLNLLYSLIAHIVLRVDFVFAVAI